MPAKKIVIVLGLFLCAMLLLWPTQSASSGSVVDDPSPTPISLPDLVLDEFAMAPERPQVNEPVTITTQIRNAGTGDAPGWRLNLYIDPPDQPPTSTTPYSKTAPYFVTFPPGDTGTVTLSGYTFERAGCGHVIYAWVDPREGIPESDETNNMRAIRFCVDSPGAAPSTDAYEPDDTCPEAHDLPLNGLSQTHNFMPSGPGIDDVDWVKAYVNAGITYTFQATGVDAAAYPRFSCAGYACRDVTCGIDVDQWRLPAQRSGWYHLQLWRKRGTVWYDTTAEYQVAVQAEAPADQPYAAGVLPAWTVKGQQEGVEIIGQNFITDTQAVLCPYEDDACHQMGCVTLTTRWHSVGHLSAAIPPDLPLSSYCLTVRNPTGKDSTLPEAFALLSDPVDCEHLARLYGLKETACERLATQGVLVLDHVGYDDLKFSYKHHQYSGLDVVVTSDAMLHLFHSTFNGLLETVEKEQLYAEVLALTQGMQASSEQAYRAAEEGTMVRSAARHNLIVFSVARKLLEEEGFEPPEAVRSQVLTYTRRVMEHRKVEVYPGDDYTQYEPRGHYAGDPQLERYFRAVKWLSRRIYRVEDECYPDQAEVELAAAALMARQLRASPAMMTRWQRVYDVIRLLAGPADSITPPMVNQAVEEITGGTVVLPWLEDADVRAQLREELMESDAYPTSEIIPVPTRPPCPIPPRYVQFIGERYLPDAEVMQETIYPHTTRTLPSGLDVMAALLSSEKADELLTDEKAAYPELAGQLEMLRAQFRSYPESWWTRSVYNGWLYTLEPLVAPVPADAPSFMRTEAWERKSLHTALASWSQLRHDMILYGKQTISSIGSPPPDGYGYVEPVPDFYRRLRALSLQTQEVLQQYDMLPVTYRAILTDMAQKLTDFETYAVKFRNGQPLTWAEHQDIYNFYDWMEELFGAKVKDPWTVADVATEATDPNTGRVLHEGIGLFHPLLILYTAPDGAKRVGVGTVMSYYEFAQPDYDRLTDQEWREMVEARNLPARPAWVQTLLASYKPEKRVYLPLILRK